MEFKKKMDGDNIFNFLHFPELIEAVDRRAGTSFFQLIRFEDRIANASAIWWAKNKYRLIFTNIYNIRGSVF